MAAHTVQHTNCIGSHPPWPAERGGTRCGAGSRTGTAPAAQTPCTRGRCSETKWGQKASAGWDSGLASIRAYYCDMQPRSPTCAMHCTSAACTLGARPHQAGTSAMQRNFLQDIFARQQLLLTDSQTTPSGARSAAPGWGRWPPACAAPPAQSWRHRGTSVEAQTCAAGCVNMQQRVAIVVISMRLATHTQTPRACRNCTHTCHARSLTYAPGCCG